MTDNNLPKENEGHEGEEEGDTGREVKFRYQEAFISSTRDESSPAEKKRLSIIHADIHRDRVRKQKKYSQRTSEFKK